jgi:hypothetical protein
VRVHAPREGEVQDAVHPQVVKEAGAALEQRAILHPCLAAADLPRQVAAWGPALTFCCASFRNRPDPLGRKKVQHYTFAEWHPRNQGSR